MHRAARRFFPTKLLDSLVATTHAKATATTMTGRNDVALNEWPVKCRKEISNM